MSERNKLVAIVVPLSNRPELTRSEQISLRHLRHYLGSYDKYMVVPNSLKVDFPDFGIKHFDDNYFGSAEAHKKMLFNRQYYEAFGDYKFLLTYHLDALVFSDQLKEWCERDFDFIGPPWIVHNDSPNAGIPALQGKVGNGGFSLKKISSFLKVFDSRKRAVDPDEYWRRISSSSSGMQRLTNLPKKYLMRFHRFNNVRWELARYRHSEELFLVKRAQHYYPEFCIPSVEIALSFGFETVPRYCYELNNHQLPFGCHAWERYDRDFWEPYLLK